MNIVVGITGGIAAYKAVNVVRGLVLAGHDVHVVATQGALRFVGRPTLEAISRNPVHSELYEGVAEVRHVAIGQAADVIVVAPATANSIAKIAVGLADDLLGNTILASSAPLVLAPAMHTEMWQNPATMTNVAALRARGVHFVGPASGQLTGSDSGPGRMAEPDDIIAAALELAGSVAGPTTPTVTGGDLTGRRVLITAGGTREPLDPVRFIGNRSSGKQGVALARAAAARGADVSLIVANLDEAVLDALPGTIGVTHVSTTLELQEAALLAAGTAELIIMAAAVADYRPETVADRKIKKETQGEILDLRLVKNPDILHELTSGRHDGQVIVGFAAETEPDPEALLALAVAKRERKGVDFLVVNRVGWTETFGSDDNAVIVLDATGRHVAEAHGDKQSVADRILDVVTAPSALRP
ncbi:MAG TPA: bifunctional phosphopantothenoylcysteine decarboxylase/phosphopantothenate--cysteine ligase CoaBC [Pseudolysinimonas sp.]|nr:bifunctional phosphopantothenoylcysteine decarboxylase/phosphopantothenate--cysteine ligase CoaBC [Pseudolysinimonas sp.]